MATDEIAANDGKVEMRFERLASQYGFHEAAARVRPRSRLDPQGKLVMVLPGIETEKILDSVIATLRSNGSSGWQHAGGQALGYGGYSLTCNPDHADQVDPRFSSLGSPRNRYDNFSTSPKGSAAAAYGSLENSYFDTYAFRVRTPASREGALGSFIDSVPLSPVRSRVGVIPGGNYFADGLSLSNNLGWHHDEPVFANLRINVPLRTDENFVFEQEGIEPYNLVVGHAYTWDTSKRHRVYCRRRTRTMRIHLVLGFAPWFTYQSGDDSWVPNEFFGRVHPFDMVAEGAFGPHIRLAHSPAGRTHEFGADRVA